MFNMRLVTARELTKASNFRRREIQLLKKKTSTISVGPHNGVQSDFTRRPEILTEGSTPEVVERFNPVHQYRSMTNSFTTLRSLTHRSKQDGIKWIHSKIESHTERLNLFRRKPNGKAEGSAKVETNDNPSNPPCTHRRIPRVERFSTGAIVIKTQSNGKEAMFEIKRSYCDTRQGRKGSLKLTTKRKRLY